MKRLEEYVNVGTKRLRCGYTTGTCAAAATRAASELLFGHPVDTVQIATPAGLAVVVDVEEAAVGDGWAQAAVRKDAGDDPDVTDGILVFARVEISEEPGIRIEGGEGIGRVTCAGLDQPVGEAAINSVPRRMIREQVEEALKPIRSVGSGGNPVLIQSCFGGMPTWHSTSCGTARGTAPTPNGAASTQAAAHDACDDEGGLALAWTSHALKSAVPAGRSEESGGAPGPTDTKVEGDHPTCPQVGILVTISAPDGEHVAEKTFNPRLGIEGGISIIGTSGIVRPMSEEALVASIELEMRVLAERGVRDVLVVPGNYGRSFAEGKLDVSLDDAVQCSNFFGATIDAAVRLGFERMLIVGHIGKMAKVAGGVMHTHSRMADCRVEVLAAHAALAGADRDTVARIMNAATTDAALDALAEKELVDAAMDSLMESLADKLAHRAGDTLRIEAIVFSNVYGVLGKTSGADGLLEVLRRLHI